MNIYQKLGAEIDKAIDARNAEEIEAALAQIEDHLGGAHPNDPILLYFRANCFAGLRQVRRSGVADAFDWKQPELSEEILSLRRSIRSAGFAALDNIRRCQILTNLGNALNTVGRPIEAIAAWDAALGIEKDFAMVAANRAYGLLSYSSALYDPGHQCVFLLEAAKSFKIALGDKAIFESDYPEGLREQFEKKLNEVEQYMEQACNLDGFDPNGFELGACDDAIALNQWRLDNRLFLNPLNDLGAWPIAAQDIFHLPRHTMDLDEKANYAQYFDLIRQEYVAACVLLFEALDAAETHPADRTLLTFEHADYSVSSVQIEKKKASFRLAYSLLDKCAVFMNAYFALGHDVRSVSFRKLWFANIKARQLHGNIPLKNWRLRGVYAISLDLFDQEFRDVSSPLAVKADDVRNAAEHRFLTVHEFMKPDSDDPCVETITEDELDELCLDALRRARATIMGLSLAVDHHEKYLKERSPDGLTMPIPVMRKRRE